MTSGLGTATGHIAIERQARSRTGDSLPGSSESLAKYRDVHAWVLIADPGAGKSDVFETLSTEEGGRCISARDFVTLGYPADGPAPIFIDGLDEVSAGRATGTTALEAIRATLQALGIPKFRISCREADWRGNADSQALRRLVGTRGFLELHLEPLHRSQSAALVAHWQQSGQPDAENFIREAEIRDLDGLLENPQTLKMLVNAVAAGGWPESKTQTYELACAKLVQEHNEEWIAARRYSPTDEQALEAAGYLSAILLLSGNATIARRRHAEATSGTMALTDLSVSTDAPDAASCGAVLQTRLFKGNGRGEFWPVHRTVAEYLAARYLVSRIGAGLPPNRVLALMLGVDNGVVPELRGLHAWLAAVAPASLRKTLIDHDPLGVVLHGDVRNFSRPEKLHLIDALLKEAKRYTYFRSQNWTSNPFGALATPDMEKDFKERFQSADRCPAHLALVDCLIDALAHGHYLPELSVELEAIVRDKTFWSGSRKEALKILIAYAGRAKDWSIPVQLLADIDANLVEDREDELLGKLLQTLFPGRISPTELWRYFRKPKSETLLGAYWWFWNETLKTHLADDEVPALLNALLATGYQLGNQHDSLGSARIVGDLLVRGVNGYGEVIDQDRLYGWLSLGLGPHQHCPLESQHKTALGHWLGEHPMIFKALFTHGLRLQSHTDNSAYGKLWRVRAQFYGAPEPNDAALWYVSLAATCADDDLRRRLVEESFIFLHTKNGPNAAIEFLENWSSGHAADAAWVENFLCCAYPPEASQQESIDFERKYKILADEKSRQAIDFFRQTLPSFAKGTAHLGALEDAANAYLNFFQNSKEETPGDRLFALLNHDPGWVNLAMHGLHQTLFRTDLPSAEQIIALQSKNRRYVLAVPCLAAMEMRYKEDPESALDLPPSTLETVAAFRLTNDFHETPAWFIQLLAQRPTILADVMQHLITQQIASKTEHISALYPLARDPAYAMVAKTITAGLLAAFPSKASKKQLKNLRLLIVAALGHLDSDTQRKLIADKMSTKPIDIAQQVYWLTAAVLTEPALYQERTRRFVEKTQSRTSHLFALMKEFEGKGNTLAALPCATQAFLIGLLGPASSPRQARRAGIVTPAMEMGEYVEGLISALAGDPGDAAVEALTALQQRQGMRQWEASLRRALYDQRITRRKARFIPASVAQVCATLANGKPANAADLRALTLRHATQLAHDIRHSNTNDYRQYWKGETHEIEEECRNRFLSDLRPLLEHVGVNTVPEAFYADEKRADIKAMYPPYQVPIEIKGDWSSDLWKAIPDQLVAKYGRERSSDGNGIFIVFWVTGKFKSIPTDGGDRPKTPQELQRRLAATVPSEFRGKIDVLVVDCSKNRPA